MAGKATIRDVDRGLRKLLDRLSKKARLKVGVFGDDAARAAVDGDGATVGDIASSHEFRPVQGGAPRAWLRPGIDENLDQILSAERKAARAIYDGMAPEQAVGLIGHGIVGLIKTRMIGGIAPALSERYLPIKLEKYPGATTPLIASGQFIGSVTHAVEITEGKK